MVLWQTTFFPSPFFTAATIVSLPLSCPAAAVFLAGNTHVRLLESCLVGHDVEASPVVGPRMLNKDTDCFVWLLRFQEGPVYACWLRLQYLQILF